MVSLVIHGLWYMQSGAVVHPGVCTYLYGSELISIGCWSRLCYPGLHLVLPSSQSIVSFACCRPPACIQYVEHTAANIGPIHPQPHIVSHWRFLPISSASCHRFCKATNLATDLGSARDPRVTMGNDVSTIAVTNTAHTIFTP